MKLIIFLLDIIIDFLGNKLCTLQSLYCLNRLNKLGELRLQNKDGKFYNPVCLIEKYRDYVVNLLPNLKSLDYYETTILNVLYNESRNIISQSIDDNDSYEIYFSKTAKEDSISNSPTKNINDLINLSQSDSNLGVSLDIQNLTIEITDDNKHNDIIMKNIHESPSSNVSLPRFDAVRKKFLEQKSVNSSSISNAVNNIADSSFKYVENLDFVSRNIDKFAVTIMVSLYN